MGAASDAPAPPQGPLPLRHRRRMREAESIEARGYPGRYREVARFVAELKRRNRTGEGLIARPSGLLPRQALGLLLTRAERYPEIRCKVFYQRDYLSLITKYGLEDASG